MSRSYRKTPIFGNTSSDSEKEDKRKANRKLRHKVKQEINRGEEVLSDLKEVAPAWGFSKDGKHYWADAEQEDMRK
jgi:hypothetical protein